MAEFIVVQTSADDSLQDFSRYLWQQKVPHRIVTEHDQQLLLVGSKSDAAQVSRAYQGFLAGAGELPEIQRHHGQELLSLSKRLMTTPVTLVALVLSVLGFLLVEFDPHYDYVRLFTFFEFARQGRFIEYSLPQGEYWRLITPIFLHFSWMHIVFNALWLWDLGGRIERIQGSLSMIGIILVMGLGSNIAQSVFAEVSVFGGMSGVIYGLLGYGWMWSVLCPGHSLGIPRSVTIFMLVWLVVCIMGGASLLGAGAVANAAHVGGLVMGLVLGLGAGLIARLSKSAG